MRACPVHCILPAEPIDVEKWLPDEEFSRYPEGTRPKRALFPPPNLPLDYILRDRRYLFKRSAGRYPDQFWAEVVAYQVGCLLGVSVPPAFAAWDSSTGICAALIEWFYEDDQAVFVSGGSYMQRLIRDYDRKEGTQHNFHAVRLLWRALQARGRVESDWPDRWADTLLFDTLIGNTDRHQDNWGVVFSRVDAGRKGVLSPCYDNGTSLGHERFEERIAGWTDKEYCRYILRGTHHMKWRQEDAQRCGHFEMVRRLIHLFPEQRTRLREAIAQFDIAALDTILEHLCNHVLPVPLTAERARFMLQLVDRRRALLLEYLQ